MKKSLPNIEIRSLDLELVMKLCLEEKRISYQRDIWYIPSLCLKQKPWLINKEDYSKREEEACLTKAWTKMV